MESDDTVLSDLLQYIQSLFQESDRGFVLLATERLDALLKDLHGEFIAMNCSSSDKWIKQILSFPGPISSFSARIKIGFGYGLISELQYGNLEILRELRNDAAHPRKPFSEFSFRQADIREKIARFRIADFDTTGLRIAGEEFKAVQEFGQNLNAPSPTIALDGIPEGDHIKLYFAVVIELLASSILAQTSSILLKRL